MNFGRVRNATVGDKAGAKGADGKDIVRVSLLFFLFS